MYRRHHSVSVNARPIAQPAKLPASKPLPLLQVLAGIYASIWGSIVAFAGIVLLKRESRPDSRSEAPWR